MLNLSSLSPNAATMLLDSTIEVMLWMTHSEYRNLRQTETRIPKDQLAWFILFVEAQ